MKRTTITLREDQYEWVKENRLNLSGVIQDHLDELIEEREP